MDEITVEQLGDYIKENWDGIREQIRRRKYKPQPVRRVEISKTNGGVRNLGTLLPPILSNIMLNEPDKELEARQRSGDADRIRILLRNSRVG